MLGIAKLLLPVVHVKRETLYVVSPAMTGLMRDLGRNFHMDSSFEFRVFVVHGKHPFLRTWGLALWLFPPQA